MTTETRSPEPAGGDGLLFIIAATIILVVGVEILFIAFAGWWLLAAVVVLVIAAAVGVCSALVRLIDDDTPVPSFQPRSEPTPAAPRIPAPSRRTAVTH